MTDRDRRIAEMTGRGMSRQEVADAIGVSPKTVQRTLAVPEVRAVAQAVQAQVDPSAQQVLRSLLTHSDAGIRLRAAVALLQRPDSGDELDAGLPDDAIVIFPEAA